MLGRRKNISLLFFGVSSSLFLLLIYFYFYNSSELLFKVSSINATLPNGKSPFNAITKLPNDQTTVDDEFDSKKLAELNKHIWRTIQWDHPAKRMSHPECDRLVAGEPDYVKQQAEHRFVYADAANLSVDCGSIRARNHFAGRPLSEAEAQFPLAYARIVHEDFRFVEAELATNYQPQNWYCFSVDYKATDRFRQQMEALATCFPNVLIPEPHFSVDSAGHRMGAAFVSCMRALAAADRKWRYLFTLQNHDVQVKTNEELVHILGWLGGANDVQYEFEHGGPQSIIRDLQRRFDWSFAGLKLFRNDSQNHRQNADGKQQGLRLAKGQVQSSLARDFVDFLVFQLDLTRMMMHLDSWNYGADELFFQTLSASDDLNAPGAFTHKCYDQHVNVPYITRYTVWNYGPGRWENVGTCQSNIYRHFICMLGIEDLSKNVRDSKHLFVNKMMPWADFGAILCWHEEMRRRTFLDRGSHRLDPEFYQNWPQTRFYREWLKTGDNVDLERFDCASEWSRKKLNSFYEVSRKPN